MLPRNLLLRLCSGLLALLLSGLAHAEDILTLYQQARAHDAELQAAEYELQAERQIRPQAKAALLPQIALEAGHSRIEADTPTGDNEYSQNQVQLSLVQSLFHRERSILLQQADTAVTQAEAEYAASVQNLVLTLADRYFNVLAAIDSLEFARAELKAISQQLEQAQRRYQVGLIAVTDIKEAQAQYDLAQAQAIEAENLLANTREALGVVIGGYPRDLAKLEAEIPLAPPEPQDIDSWVEIAENQNLSYQAARLGVEIARQEIDLQRAGHYPTIDLVARHGYQDNDDGFSEGETNTTSLGLQLNVPLYSGGLTTAQVGEARARFDAAVAQLEFQRRILVQQTREAYLGVSAAISRVQALRQALVSTQAAAEATQTGFEVGTRTAVEVLVALRETYRAQRDYARARYDYILHSLRLKQAAGTLTAEALQDINTWLQP